MPDCAPPSCAEFTISKLMAASPPGDAGEQAGQAEGDEADGLGVVADEAGPLGIVAHGVADAAEAACG